MGLRDWRCVMTCKPSQRPFCIRCGKLESEDFELMKAAGLNVLRLGAALLCLARCCSGKKSVTLQLFFFWHFFSPKLKSSTHQLIGGVMWPGVEPQRGIYNETYLRIVKDIVEEAATYGIYVLADMHQEPIQWMYRWYLGAWPKPWESIHFYERILC